jgi:hypothetical protein
MTCLNPFAEIGLLALMLWPFRRRLRGKVS